MAQIGTIRLETQNNGTVSVPVFNTGDSGSSVYEFVRVQTASGVGFIPVVDPADASFPYLRVQSQNQGVVAVHNEASLFTAPVQASDLYLWYPFINGTKDETANDGILGQNNVTVGDSTDYTANEFGGPTYVSGGSSGSPTDINEGPDSAYYDFDGTDDRLDGIDEFYSDMTIMCWVNLDDADRQYFIDFGRNNLSIGHDINSGTDGFVAKFYDGNSHYATSGITQTNTWVHVAGRYDDSAGFMEVFVDGQLEGSVSGSQVLEDTQDGIVVANKGQDTGDGQTNGSIDDVRIYLSTLSDSQISQIYNNTRP